MPPRHEKHNDEQWRMLQEYWDEDADAGKHVPGCGAFNHTSARRCCNCGFDFLFLPKISAQASNTELIRRRKKPLTDPPQIIDFPVDKIVYEVHSKEGGFDSMKVTYHCGMRRFKEWVPAWHQSGVKHKGRNWWAERTSEALPDTAAEAVDMSDELKVPVVIRVWLNKKYPEVMGSLFNKEHIREQA